MKATTVEQPEMARTQLEQAFDIFNQVSADLGSNFRVLETRVAGLQRELAASNSARIKELTAKEELAAKLSALMDALPGGVLVLDANDHIQEANPVATALLGDDYVDTNWRLALRTAAKPDSASYGEVSLKNGKRVSISRNSFGEDGAAIILLTDISENYRLNNLINRDKRLSALGEMAARLAHQVRTPLSSAILYLSHLSSIAGRSPEKASGIVGNVHSRLRQIEKLVDGMLSYIRGDIEANQQVSLNEILKEVRDASILQIRNAHGELQLTLPSRECNIIGNKVALFNAILNLIDNSLQASESAPRIDIALEQIGDDYLIHVADNGQGIADELKEQIFDPFFSSREGGTGLGLAVVQSAVKAHRGTISVESYRGHGTTFTLTFPRESDSLTGEAGMWASDLQKGKQAINQISSNHFAN